MFIEDPWNYRLHILVKGIPESFSFDIERKEGERLQSLLVLKNDEDASASFICFRCKDDTQVALNIDDIEMVNYLWENGIYVNDKEGEPEGCSQVRIYFQGRPEPYKSATETMDEIEAVFEEFALNPFVQFEFLSYTDEDGEIVTFRAGHVAMMTVEKGLLDPDE